MELKMEQTYRVDITDIDFMGNMDLYGISNKMQIIAADHAEVLDFNYYKSQEKAQYYWVLSRVKYVINDYPKWLDEVKLITYPGGADKLFAVRLFELEDKEGQKIGHIIGDYLLLDVEKGRPTPVKKAGPLFEKLNFPYEGDKLDKLSMPIDILAEDQRKARYSHIDVNGHMNNAAYISWIVDMLSLETLKHKEIATLQINYVTSVMWGDEVKVVMGYDEKKRLMVAGTSLDKKTIYFNAEMTLRDK